MAEPQSVLFVCLGNICRSPMADAILRHKLAERGLEGWRVDSAGTGAYHVGEAPDPRTQAVLKAHRVPIVGTARQIVPDDFAAFDYVLAMDRSNLERLRSLAPSGQVDKAALVLDATSLGEVPDPYYGGDDGFEDVYAMLDEALEAWLQRWT